MKTLINTLFLAVLLFASCNNQEQKTENKNQQEQPDPKDEYVKLNEFLQKFDEPSQSFKAGTNKPIKVKGKYGTIISISPSDLETESGQSVGKEVVIELKELTNRQQLLRANAQTVSDGQQLISGGAYYINATSDGQQLKLKDGKTYSVEFPKISNDDMDLYYGQRDGSGKMNWQQAQQKFKSPKPKQNEMKKYEAIIVADGMRNPDTARVALKNISKEELEDMKREEKISDKVYSRNDTREKTNTLANIYSPIPVRTFGWFNCDKVFPKVPATNIQFTISNKAEEANYVKAYLIYKDLNSVLQATYYTQNDKIEKEDFNNVPIGANVRFFAVCYQNHKIMATLTEDVEVTENLSEKLLLKEINEADFDKLLTNVE